MNHRFYRLEGKQPVPGNLQDFVNLVGGPDELRRVASDNIGEVTVSTVFLGLNHQFATTGQPLIFETLVMGGALDNSEERYSTWEEAEAGHQRWVAAVRQRTFLSAT